LGPAAEIEELTRREEAAAEPFNPQGIADGRRRIIASLVRRQGQADFRAWLLDAYGRRCAITGCNVIEALEAAHITPYLGRATNYVGNGLLLRSDIHTLFDLGLLAIDPDTLTVLVAPGLESSDYGELAGTRLWTPASEACWPSRDALRQHRAWSGL
jgi:predicted restriction endonuclease